MPDRKLTPEDGELARALLAAEVVNLRLAVETADRALQQQQYDEARAALAECEAPSRRIRYVGTGRATGSNAAGRSSTGRWKTFRPSTFRMIYLARMERRQP